MNSSETSSKTRSHIEDDMSALEVSRYLKDEFAKKYDYDIQAIGRALREAQKAHPEKIVNRAALLASAS